MTPVVRELDWREIEAVVELSLRAWAPVHESIATMLGPELNEALNLDWRGSQEREVRAACVDGEDRVWVADPTVGTGSDPGHAPARRTYEKAGMKLIPMSRYFLRL